MRQPVLTAAILTALAAVLASAVAQAPKTGAGNAPGLPSKQRDLTNLAPQQRNIYLSGQRGLEWLQRANKQDGRFIYGLVPALRLPMEGDSYLRQAGAAFALARAAKFYGDDRAAAIAKQALLTLLLETGADPREPHSRTVPAHLANPLAAAGTLLAAIHELPAPAADLLDQGDQLANMLRDQLLADGSFKLNDIQQTNGAADDGAAQHYSGPALYGIVRSQALRPAPWKVEAVGKARAHYFAYWRQHKNMPMLAWHTAAYTEAFLLSKDAGFAEAVFEMNDWLCGLQYQQVDPARAAWAGGFQPWVNGKAVPLAPDIGSAGALVSLGDACRLARAAGDVQRYERYRQALENGLRFVLSLQYTEANTRHFADWYRPALVGAFYASQQDGNLRLDYTQQALTALVRYLRHVADLPDGYR
jgi:hypothetical protein